MKALIGKTSTRTYAQSYVVMEMGADPQLCVVILIRMSNWGCVLRYEMQQRGSSPSHTQVSAETIVMMGIETIGYQAKALAYCFHFKGLQPLPWFIRLRLYTWEEGLKAPSGIRQIDVQSQVMDWRVDGRVNGRKHTSEGDEKPDINGTSSQNTVFTADLMYSRYSWRSQHNNNQINKHRNK